MISFAAFFATERTLRHGFKLIAVSFLATFFFVGGFFDLSTGEFCFLFLLLGFTWDEGDCTSFFGPAFREIKDLFGCFRAGMINRRGSQACGRSCVIKDREACAQ